MLLLGKRIFVPAMVSSYILFRPKNVYASQPSLPPSDREKFPKYFLDKISELNAKDSKYANEIMKENLINYYPNKYKYIVENIEKEDIISELDWIRLMYNRPLSCDRKISLRNKICKIIKDHNLSEKELELLEYLLKYYNCI